MKILKEILYGLLMLASLGIMGGVFYWGCVPSQSQMFDIHCAVACEKKDARLSHRTVDGKCECYDWYKENGK